MKIDNDTKIEKGMILKARGTRCDIGNLIIRKNVRNPKTDYTKYGDFFIGCTKFPKCYYTEELDVESKDQGMLFTSNI